MSKVRTRFAPSPTGALHAGTIRTALFAWILAEQNNGDFILRIEDTDQAREVDGAVENIQESLEYLGINWTESPDNNGPYGPYTQSQRLDIYKTWANKLVEKGRAYADPYSQSELNELREKSKASKKAFLFRDYRPENPPEWDGSQPLRFKSEPRSIKWQDEVMGEMSASSEAFDDFIIMKSDGFPTYNFAHIIDDYLMKITHVVRSQEFVSSMPRFIDLHSALDLPLPKFATVPAVLAPGGKKKLSKRDGAKQILEYKRLGYPKEALFNYLSSLGWNDGTDQEIFNIAEIVKKFNLKHVQKSGAIFDDRRLLWMSGQHIRRFKISELLTRAESFWPEEASNYSSEYRQKVLEATQERLKYFAELPELTIFFFKELELDPKLIFDHKQLKKLKSTELFELLNTSKERLEATEFNENELEKALNELLEKTQTKPAILFSLIRIAITQSPSSPGLALTLSILGKETSLKRINKQLEALQKF
jgi:glutamyl-tRNA synthetase